MGTSNSLPNVRTTSDLTIKVRLKDGGLAIDWTGLTDIKAWIYSDVQKAIAGRCTVSIDQADSTLLLCDYSAFKPQYLGVNRIIVQCKNEGRTKTYDTPALNFVPFSTMDSRETPLSNPDDIEAHIEVQDVSSSILDEVIIAALNATERANEAAAAAEHMVDIHQGPPGPAGKAPYIDETTGNWFVWDDQTEQYVDSGNHAQGTTGNGIASWSVVESQEDGGSNVVTVTFTDGTSETFTYKNGHTGATPAISIGTVETGAAGSEAEASMTGTPENPVLNLTIPRGDPGVVQAKYLEVQNLPTASASTMNALYLVPSELGTPNVYDVYYTTEVGRETYSWIKLCTTEINLSNYATKAELTQLEAKVDGIPGSTTTEEIIRTDYTETSHTISAQGKWVSSPTGKSILVPVSPGQILKYQSGTNDAIVSLLKTDTYEQGETPDFCDDYQGRFIPTDGQQVTLPTDCNYLYILVKTSSGYVDSREFLITQTPSVPGLTDKVEDLQDNITDLEQDISDLKDSVEDVEAEIGDMSVSESVDLSLYEESGKAVDSDGVWRVGTPKYKGVPVIPGRDYKIYAIAETLFSILAENAGNAGTSVDFATGYTSRIIIQDGDVYNFVAPVDALYLWVRVKDTAGNDVAPTIIESYSKTVVSELKKKMDNLVGLKHIYENIPVSVDSDGWEKPVTPGMVIALKRATQASQIRYTAKKVYPTNTSPTTGAIGEHSGFPYSSTKEIRKYICWEVSQRTFMTAVNNQYGLFYTEDIASAYNISEYGYSYNGVNCGSYYGMVCSIFALWCLGFNVPWDTKQFAYLTKIGKLIRLENQTAQGAHICDLIWLSGHTRLVTGVQRDEWGNVINVKVTESASNVAVTNYTAESFQAYLTSHNCILYRSTDLYKNTDYVPSEFVAVCGESEPEPYPYNDYICHYAGDYSAMRADQPTWINYSLGNYTGMKIRKDGATWITIPLNGDAHKVDITTYLDGAGKYEACLTDGVNDSELTHWQLVDAGCTYEDNGTTQKITFASSNGTPWWLQVCSDNGTAYCWYEITDADIAVGYVELDLASMITEQYGAVSGTMYIRVMYKADYGGVASEMVQR